MIALLIGIVLLVGGAIVLFKELSNIEQLIQSIGAILVWLVMIVVIITWAEQHDDPWEQYVANGVLVISSSIGGFLASLAVIKEKFQSLKQRLDDHVTADTKVFDQFEKRMMEKSDQLGKNIMQKLDGVTKSRKT